MSNDDNGMHIRSFRTCFAMERRLHKIDRWRLPVPYGVPLRGIAYAVIMLLVVGLLTRLPVTKQMLGMFPFGVRFVVLPFGSAWLLLRWKLDGRPAHIAAVAWMRYRFGPDRICGFRPQPAPAREVFGPVTAAPGDIDPGHHRAEIVGPATVVLRYPTEFEQRGSVLRVRRLPGDPQGRGKQVEVAEGQKVVIL